MRSKRPLIALGIAVIATAVLYLLPRVAGDDNAEAASVLPQEHSESGATDVQSRIDAAIEKVEGGAPMQGILELKAVADSFPDDPRPQYYLGMFSIQSGQFDKAVERFERVLALDPEASGAQLMLAEALIASGRESERAKSLLEAYLESTSDERGEARARELLESVN